MASVGSTYASLGKYSVATACFKQALAAAKQQGDNKQNEATFTANIAAMLTLANKTDEAISYSEAAISIFGKSVVFFFSMYSLCCSQLRIY